MTKDTTKTKNIDQDAKNWRLGVLYFNRQDKRTIVPNRNAKYGPTFNFASPYTILILLGTIVLVLLMAIVPEFIK